MANFDVERSPILELTIGVVDSILSSLLFLIPLIYYGKDPIPSIFGINLTGLTLILLFPLKSIAHLVNDFILRRYYKINLSCLFNYAYLWIIACNTLFLVFYTMSTILINFGSPQSKWPYKELKEWLDVGLPVYFPHFLIGFHLIFGFHVIAIYIYQKPKKWTQIGMPKNQLRTKLRSNLKKLKMPIWKIQWQ